ncbi:YeiH family protein [Amycolatopsis suaedae]|uniref:Putative sulfate exporter family transporter n=1 Tax=Amycolatopsis suaedae TaxID=2510978 RepID=A0A4Q7JC07_9PSEU|nr:putative sulfate exporter family transporter [Amycolatopsis suaedae]RZQ64648.1 putative sulfate exporter family transporter [Amycolatopsis suaedae]
MVATAARTRLVPGLVVVAVVAAVATVAGRLVPLVGGPVFGIVLGVLAGMLLPALRHERFGAGYSIAARPVLQLSIVVLGTGLSLQQVVRVGGESLPVMLGTLAVALGGAWLLGRLLGVRGDTQILIGVGTGICGASAIAATSAVLRPRDADIAYALGTIFTFNIAAVLIFPPLGHLMGMSPQEFGLWAGTAVNDTSSVVAATVGYGGDAGSAGIVVKLTRALTLIPIVLVLAVFAARRDRARARLPWHRMVPLFLIGFLLAAGLNSAGMIPAAWHEPLAAAGTFLVTAALAGIGLSLDPGQVRAAGARPLLLGGVLWIAVAASSLGLQALVR